MARSQAESTTSLAGFRSFYGAGPLHLLGLLLAFALTAYTLSVIGLSALWDPEVWWQSILVWFLGAVIAHDLIVFPIYAAVDRALHRATHSPAGTGQDAKAARHAGVSALNYLRVPLMAVALMFVLFFPGIVGQGADTYVNATGQTQEPFLRRWLLLSAIAVAVAAAAYALRLVAHRRAANSPTPTDDSSVRGSDPT